VGLVTAVALALAPAACSKKPGPPSDAYAQAQQRFSKLYGQKLDEAFVDPAMTRIEEQLHQVPADSVDAPAAQELLGRIQDGRARMEAQRKEQEAAIANAHAPLEVPGGNEPETQAPPPAPVDAGQPDAGQPKEPAAGTPASELASGYNGCFQKGQQINVEGRGFRDAWEMSERTSCRLEYPGSVGKVVIVEGDKVLAVLPKSSLTVTSEQPPAQDAGR
jgi:hypothetical protein